MQMIAFVLPSPTIGISSARNASVGTVYRIPLTAIADVEHPLAARRSDADRERKHERDRERRAGDDEVLAQRDRHLVPVAQEPRSSLRVSSRAQPIRRPPRSRDQAAGLVEKRARDREPRAYSAPGALARASRGHPAREGRPPARRSPPRSRRDRRGARASRRAWSRSFIAIGAWSSIPAETGRKSRHAGFARWRRSFSERSQCLLHVAKPDCCGPWRVSCSGRPDVAGASSCMQRSTMSAATCATREAERLVRDREPGDVEVAGRRDRARRRCRRAGCRPRR